DFGAMFRIVEITLAGELVALLPVLAAPLTVRLAGDRCIPASFTADAPGSEDDVDRPQHVLHAVAVVLNSASMQQKARPGRPPPLGRLSDPPFGDARHLSRACRGPLTDALGELVEPDGG